MAASEKWALQATFARLRNRGVPAAEIKTPNLLALIPAALERLALKRPDLFQEETTLTLASGVGALSDLEDDNFILNTIDTGQIFHDDNDYPLQPLEDEAQASFPWPDTFIYYWITGKQLKTLNTDGGKDTLSGDLRITATKIPAIADLNAEQQPLFLDEMEALATPTFTKK